VYVVVQPYGEWYDFRSTPVHAVTNVFEANWDRQNFYFPASYDIYIAFAPIGNSEYSPWRGGVMGRVRFRAKIV